MNITPELVEHIADLSRLELGREEVRETAARLEQIAACMDILNRLDTRGIQPMSHIFPVENVLREDTVLPSQDRAELLACAPASDGETFLVPRAVE